LTIPLLIWLVEPSEHPAMHFTPPKIEKGKRNKVTLEEHCGKFRPLSFKKYKFSKSIT